MSKSGIIGPFWFENADGSHLGHFLPLINISSCSDKTTPHTANITMEWLDHRIPDWLINWRIHLICALRFSLWGSLIDHVYENTPQSIPELKAIGGHHPEDWFH